VIGDDEFLYRKVPVSQEWYNPVKKELKPKALNPRPIDTEGISLDRAKSRSHPEFRSIEQAAKGPSAKGYYVVIFRVGDLRSQGFTVEADPLKENPGHTLLKDLTYENRKDPQSREKMLQLAHQLVVRVEGPFHAEAGEKE